VHGELVCVLAVESQKHTAFDPGDEALLSVVASQIASAIQIDPITSSSSSFVCGLTTARRNQDDGPTPDVRTQSTVSK